MSKRTQEKLNRTRYEEHVYCSCHTCRVAQKYGLSKPRRIVGYEPPKERQKKYLKVSDGRHEMEIPVLVSIGQIINVKKQFKREMEKRSHEMA